MTKEDAGIYLATAAIVALFTPYRDVRRSTATVALAALWLVFAFFIAIPASRAADGLTRGNPIVEDRFTASGGGVEPGLLAGRLFSASTAGHVVNLLGTAGALPMFGVPWLLPALPGIAINLAAPPESFQASLADHYVWPVLPWLFMSAAAGVVWVSRRSPRLAFGWLLLLLGATLLDSPALQRVLQTRLDPEAREVRRALATLDGDVVLAQANLIPHLPHHRHVFSVAGDAQPTTKPDLVLLTEVGNLWPLTREQIQVEVRRYESDPAYERVASGPLHAFKRRSAAR